MTNKTPSARAQAAHMNALYVAADMGFEYEAELGEMTATYDTPDFSKAPIKGTPGEVMTHEKFYVPAVRDKKDLIDLAFELGYLVGKGELSRSQDG